MSDKLKPNFTPVPNKILDEIMRGLNEGEFKTLMAICRFTYGWGKQSDRISLKQLSEITGIRDRSNVHRAIKRLGDLLVINPGDPAKSLASEYRINVDISDDLLSQKQQELLSDEQHPVVRPVVSSATFQRKPKKDIANRKSSPKVSHLNGHQRNSKAPEGYKETVALYSSLFVGKFDAKPDFDGRDGKLLSGLLKAHGAAEVQELLRFFFAHPPAWVEKAGKFTIPAFKYAYTEILAQSRNGQARMGVL